VTEPIAELLRIALHDRSVARRHAAARGLVRSGAAESAVRAGLAGALRHAAVDVRRRAAVLLGQLGPTAAGVAPDLTEALRDPGWTVREAAARALGAIGIGLPPSIRQCLVRSALHDRHRLVRDAAAEALARLGEDAVVVAELRGALRHSRVAVRCRALRVLAPFPGRAEAIVPDLDAALRESHWRVRKCAAEAVGRLGPAAGAAVTSLIRRCYDREARVGVAAARALAVLGATHGLDPSRSAEENLRAAWERRDLPDAVRDEFTRTCQRRSRWHQGHTGASPEEAGDPVWPWQQAVAAAEAVALNAPNGRRAAARDREAAWLLARLWELRENSPAGWRRR
jgi:HEAT repeat protein